MITAIHACGSKDLDAGPDIEVHRCRFPTGEQDFFLRENTTSNTKTYTRNVKVQFFSLI